MVAGDLHGPDVVHRHEGEVDDGVLQSLALMDGRDLHRGGVAVEAADALLRAGLALGPQPLQQPGRPERQADSGLVQGLGDVTQVGEQPLAADGAEDAGRQASLLGRLEEGGDAAPAHEERPAPQPVRDLVGQRLPATVELGQGEPEERRERGRPHAPRPMRLLERLEQAQPLVSGRRGQQLGAAADHRGNAACGQSRPDQLGLRPLAHEHSHVGGRDRGAVPGRVGGEEGGDVGGAVVGDVLTGGVDLDHVALDQLHPRAAYLPDPERGRRRRTGQPRAGVRGRHRAYDDARVAEGRATQHDLEPLDQGGVAPSVGAEGRAGRRGLGGREVGDHVAAAEGVDGLLGVADQDHRGVAGERPVEHLPLLGVGVLELVDEDDLPPLPHPLAGRCVVALEGLGETAQEIVVRQDPEAPLAPVDLGAHLVGERHALSTVGLRVAGRRQGRVRVADRGGGQGQGGGPPERRLRLEVAEAAEVDVVDDLLDEVVERLDQRGAGVGVAGHPERAKHGLAELVGGGDRGGVERRQRVAQPTMSEGHLGGVGVEQRGEHGVVAVGGRRVGQRALRLHQLLTHPLAELLARGPAEGDHQQLVEGGLPLGDVARHERGDGEGLAGAGAGLEEGGAGREVAREVELLAGRSRHQPPCSAWISGLQTRSARAPKREASPAKSSPGPGATPTPGRLAPGPQMRRTASASRSPPNLLLHS